MESYHFLDNAEERDVRIDVGGVLELFAPIARLRSSLTAGKVHQRQLTLHGQRSTHSQLDPN